MRMGLIRHNIQEVELDGFYESLLYCVSTIGSAQLCIRYSINKCVPIGSVIKNVFDSLAAENLDTYNVICYNHGYYTAVYVISKSWLEKLLASCDRYISENPDSQWLKEQEVVNEKFQTYI
jgi:hypothetical protein